MDGLITTRHLVLYAREIITGFGFDCYWRCLKALLGKKRVTFLDLVFSKG